MSPSGWIHLPELAGSRSTGSALGCHLLWKRWRGMNGAMMDEWMLQCRRWCIASHSLQLQIPAAAPPFTPLLHLPNLWRSLLPVNVGHIMKCLLALFPSARPPGGGGLTLAANGGEAPGASLSVQLLPHSHEGFVLFFSVVAVFRLLMELESFRSAALTHSLRAALQFCRQRSHKER